MFMLIVLITLIVVVLIVFAFLFGCAFGMVAAAISIDTSLEAYGTSPEIESFKSIFKRLYDEKVKRTAIDLIKTKVEKNSKESN